MMDTEPISDQLSELVPLMTSVYDLRLFVSLVSLADDARSINQTKRAAVVIAALSHVVAEKLVFDDHACVFFKLVLDHCKTHAWLRPADIHLLDRKAEKVNTESAEWVVELQKKVHDHDWRLGAHEHGLRRIVEGIRHVHAVMQDNRAAVLAVRSRVSHLQSQIGVAKTLMGQLVSHGNRLSDHVDKLQQRLTNSKKNLIAVAEGLHNFHSSYVSHLDQEDKTKRMKRVSGLLASVAGFVFAPVLKEAIDVVIDLTNPIEIYGLAYSETEIGSFLTQATVEHALVPLVESELEKLMIPKDAFETLLREEIALQHPELLAEYQKNSLLVMDDFLDASRLDYIKTLESSLKNEVALVDALLDDVGCAASQAAVPVEVLESYDEILDHQVVWQQKYQENTVETMSSDSESEDEKGEEQADNDGDNEPAAEREPERLGANEAAESRGNEASTIVFEDDDSVFPHHLAVHACDGNLARFYQILEGIPSEIDDRETRFIFTATTNESLCAAEYAYCLGYNEVGDFLASIDFADTWSSFNEAPAKFLKLLGDVNEFPCICIVGETEGDVEECELLCGLVHEEDHVVDARVEAEVERESKEPVFWSAVQYASHLGYVEIDAYLLKEKHRSMRMKDKIAITRQAKARQQRIRSPPGA